MKLILDIDEKDFENLKKYGVYTLSIYSLIHATLDATSLPDNATNGDVIKAMFPSIVTEDLGFTTHASTKVTCCGDKHCKGAISYDFWKEWWNAPYKGGTTE